MSFVTTVVPVYNGERFLAQALESVAQQTRRPNRLIVLDNCSTDGTRVVVESFRGMPCEYVRNETNLGMFGNHERAMSYGVETDVLHLFHHDDILKANFFERMVPVAEGVSGRALVWCSADGIDANGNPVPQPMVYLSSSPKEVPLKRFLNRRKRFLPDMYVGGCLFKTDRQPSPCHWPTHMKNVGDQLFYALWAVHSLKLIAVHEQLLCYRVHEENSFKKNLQSIDSLILEDWEALQMIEALRPRRGFVRWLRQQKLWCFYAALTHSKLSLIQHRPDYAAEVRREMRRRIHPLHWLLGKTAFHLREVVRRLRR